MKSYSFHAITTNEALTIAADVQRAAKGRALHAAILTELAGVRLTSKALGEVSLPGEQEGDPPLHPGLGVPMRAVRTNVAALADVLESYSGLAFAGELADEAKRVHDALFPDGRTFLKGTAFDLDVECGQLLDRARHEPHASILAEVGCAPIVRVAVKALVELRAARQANALVAETEVGGVNGFTALRDATDALRRYAAAVEAVDLIEKGSLQRELLAPLVNRRIVKRAHPAPTPAITPTASTANDTTADQAPPSRAA